ncbi:DNA/RNA non-specific endonuclease [Treponema sp.]|jgi:endonuclease G|uniref:DNA/RNA non-specific endonuclease n=1 Tax=Treponema sp. TaxID=166 RepID=UPI0025805AB4|nr:DNA/RNA non-specific endonuclease [Treponema sp.]MBE6353615.1 DNA/RNA non-specific endonuclease [Treponema sp.]
MSASRKKIILIVVIELILICLLLYRNSRKSQAQTPVPEVSDLELPLCEAVINGGNCPDHEIHSYAGFRLCYRESYEVAEWVSYTVTKDELVKESGRTNDFREDESISTGSASPADYYRSGYDRGHLAPAADMVWSRESMSESFYMSNMTPQTPAFNRKIWMYLESQVRIWAERYGEVTVVTGPVLDKKASEYKTIGENEVCVPEWFYKVLLVKTEEGNVETVGFLIPNEGWTGTFWDYAVTVDEVETRTSLDFFSVLDDEIENQAEGTFNLNCWK